MLDLYLFFLFFFFFNDTATTEIYTLSLHDALPISTATLAPIIPILRSGLRALSASAVRTSEANDGVDVCITTSSRLTASGATSSNLRRCGGASISFEPSTRAAGCASQVGYQNERTSRLI